MDRLSTVGGPAAGRVGVTAAALASIVSGAAAVLTMAATLAACDGGAASPGGSRSRVEAVQAAAPAQIDPKAVCETWYEPKDAPVLSLPPLRNPAPAAVTKTGAAGRSRWINVWATWCKPCIEELPRLVRWQSELGAKADFELVLLSADGEPEAVQAFAKEHPEVAGTLEVQFAESLQPWAAAIGVPGQAVLPIHVFVDGEDRVRCVRTAGVGEDDRAAIEQLLMSL